MSKLSSSELESAMRRVFGIDGMGLKWKAQKLYELLEECQDDVKMMCQKLNGNLTQQQKETKDE